MTTVRRVESQGLTPTERATIRALLDAAFDGRFTEDDWEHALGGTHLIAAVGLVLVSHASVVPRTLQVGSRSVATGYVEAVATTPGQQGHGYGTETMTEAARLVSDEYEMGALSTSSPTFYSRLGWEVWTGPTFVHSPTGRARTAAEDGGVMVLRTPATEDLSAGSPLTCDWRFGDVW